MPDLQIIQKGMRCRERSCACQHGRPNDEGFVLTHCPLKHAYKKHDRTPILWLKRGKKGKILLGCYEDCDKFEIEDALTERGLWNDGDDADPDRFDSSETQTEPPDEGVPPTSADPDFTVTSLAQAKGLNPQTLRVMGVKNLPDGGIAIPYHDLEGNVIATRHRLRLEKDAEGRADARFHDPDRAKLLPYGLKYLRQYGVTSELVIVEGESDYWTCFENGIHSLGIPGVGRVNTLESEHLERIKKFTSLKNGITAAMIS